MKEDRKSLLKNFIIPSTEDSIVLWNFTISLWKIMNRLFILFSGIGRRSIPSGLLLEWTYPVWYFNMYTVFFLFSQMVQQVTNFNLVYLLVKCGFWTRSMLSKCCFHFIQQWLNQDAPDGTHISSRFEHFDEIMVVPSSSQDVKYIWR